MTFWNLTIIDIDGVCGMQFEYTRVQGKHNMENRFAHNIQ